MKKILIPLIILLLVTPVLAPNPTSSEEINIQQLKAEHNQNLEKVPWIVKKIIGTERINLHLTTNTQEIIIIGATTESAKILSIQKGEIQDPTLKIYVTENTINRVKDKVITIQQAIETEEIRFESQRIRTSIKLWLINLFT